MIITKICLSRRTVLRGLGATLALPLLDGMVPALSAFAKTAAAPPKRLGVVYVPNGVMLDNWTPVGEGSGFALSPTLDALKPFRDRVLVVSGLSLKPADPQGGEAVGQHARPSGAFLTGVHVKRTTSSKLQSGISMDQMAAQTIGSETPLPSLELSLEPPEFQACDPGYSCAYLNISWRDAQTPMPMETSPRVVFERLFGDISSTDPAARQARIVGDLSVLDSVADKVARLQRGLGPGDRVKLDQYLEAVRDVERRIQNAEHGSARELPEVTKPAGTPTDYHEHARLLFEMQRLAYQTDMTRVITFMIGREQSAKTYPQVGVPDAHHPITHQTDNPASMAKVAKINAYHVSLFAEYLGMLAETPDGDGSLLDNVAILYGGSMGDGGKHEPRNLPIVVAGKCGGELKGGRHLRYTDETPLTNLHLSLLHKVGAPVERIGDSTGTLKELSEFQDVTG